MVDIIAQALFQIRKAEKKGFSDCVIRPVSKTLRSILDVMREKGYIGKFEFVDDNKGGILKIKLEGNVNNCGAIKPRFSTSLNDFPKFEKRYLPAKKYGFLIVSTTNGIMTQEEAKEKGIGGKLLVYVY